MDPFKKPSTNSVIIFIITFLVFALPVIIGERTYYMHVLILILVYATLGASWNLLAGFAGQLSLGHNVFFGVGAYTLGLLIHYFNINPWIALLVGGLTSTLLGLPIGAICFRLRGAYYALATLAAAEIVRVIILNSDFTLAGRGVTIPTPTSIQLGFLTIDFRSKIPYYYIALILTLATYCAVYAIARSRIGFKLLTIREDEDAASMLGIDPMRQKLYTSVVSTFIAGAIGAFYAQYITYIDASNDPGGVLSLSMALDAILVGLVGGIGTLIGPLIGAVVRIGLGEYLRVTFGRTAGVDLFVFGAILTLCVLFLRGGIWGYLRKRTGRLARHGATGS